MSITIYHNPSCSKSRKTLEIIEGKGIAPRIVRYLDETPDAATLQRLAELLGVPLRDVLRTGNRTGICKGTLGGVQRRIVVGTTTC